MPLLESVPHDHAKSQASREYSETELALKDKKRELYKRMDKLLPRRIGFWHRFKVDTTPPAVYRTEDQPDGEFTRAWLSRTRGYDEVAIVTDRITTATAQPAVVDGSSIKHFALSPSGTMYTKYYLSAPDTETLEIIEQTLDTVAIIEEATLQAKVASVKPLFTSEVELDY